MPCHCDHKMFFNPVRFLLRNSGVHYRTTLYLDPKIINILKKHIHFCIHYPMLETPFSLSYPLEVVKSRAQQEVASSNFLKIAGRRKVTFATDVVLEVQFWYPNHRFKVNYSFFFSFLKNKQKENL